MFQKAKKKAGIKKRGGIHILRHAFATHMLEDRVDIGTLQSLLGHADIGTTMVYPHVTSKVHPHWTNSRTLRRRKIPRILSKRRRRAMTSRNDAGSNRPVAFSTTWGATLTERPYRTTD
ncbi:MAG: tyrosine-type recombinase/integrase, partial [Proteobacteria bacterium]|nr:tyrosine-type recombinase/integrase [Pseudomonadota bacterium]